MLYQAYQAQADMMASMRGLARIALQGFGQVPPGVADHGALRGVTAGYEMLGRAGLSHERPPFGIERVKVGRREVAVREEATQVLPFGTLLHFAKDTTVAQPRVLLVAPLSGHFATLLRGTVRTMLAEHDVYVTDWHNARDVSMEHGRFGFDDFVDYMVRWMELLGPETHLMAVCQPCNATLAATAVLAQAGSKAQPRSLTLMAGPIDTRVNPTAVNDLATEHPLSWFDQHVITRVPFRFAGARRRVYPGFLQLTSFVSMNLERHVSAHWELYRSLAQGDDAQATTTKTFYDEYFAVMDLTAEFYLETVQRVFQEHQLARGTLEYRGTLVEPRAIRRTALLTVEGERDDICSPGQTFAAHDLCPSIKPYRRRHHLQPGVGHYGVFNGRRWERQIYPLVRNLVLSNA